jgi:hypothetical protein
MHFVQNCSYIIEMRTELHIMISLLLNLAMRYCITVRRHAALAIGPNLISPPETVQGIIFKLWGMFGTRY